MAERLGSNEDFENIEPKQKKKCLSLKKGKKSVEERFKMSSSPEIAKAKKGFVPANTKRSTNWAVRTFETWRRQRNAQRPKSICPDDILLQDDTAALCHWLCVFCKEARREDGEPYTPRSITQLLSGIQRHIRETKQCGITVLDGKNPDFLPLHRLLDTLFRELHAQGVGASRRQSAVLSQEDEERLWASGVVGVEKPESLLNAVFLYNGMFLVLRGGEEHRKLKLSQFKFAVVPDPKRPGLGVECLTYVEHGSKNRPGGTHQLNLDNKEVTHYANESLGPRCYVSLIKLYLSKLPKEAFEADTFYLKPRRIKGPIKEGEPWFERTVIGHNKLSGMVKEMLRAAGVDDSNKSNHSLRATGISRMFSSGVPEKLIMERSGHISSDGVRMYERSTAKQHQVVSDVLSGCSGYSDLLKGHDLMWASPDDIPKLPVQRPVQEMKPEPNGEEFVDEAKRMLNRRLQFQDLTSCTLNITMNF